MNLGIHMLAKFIKTLVPKPQLVHVPVDCSPLQHYPGYLPGDEALLRRYAVVSARVNDDHYLDGFGVKTEFQCVPFLAPQNLKLEAVPSSDNLVEVTLVEPLGNETLVHCRHDDLQLVGSVDGSWVPAIGDKLSVSVDQSALHFFDSETGVRVE